MAKKEKDGEISAKDIKNIIDSIDKLQKKMLEETKQLDKKLSNQVTANKTQIDSLTQNVNSVSNNVKTTIQKLSQDLSNTKAKVNTDLTNTVTKINDQLSSTISNINGQFTALKKDFDLSQGQIKDQLVVQQKVVTDMIKNFDTKFSKDKNEFKASLEELKNQQDVLKVSFSYNEKRALDSMKGLVDDFIKRAVTGKEKEILMKFWIKDLKEIMKDFEKLKKMHPKDFNLQLNEIANTIQVFRQRLSI